MSIFDIQIQKLGQYSIFDIHIQKLVRFSIFKFRSKFDFRF